MGILDLDKHGKYGDFGGVYIPEMLYGNVDELERNLATISGYGWGPTTEPIT